MYRLTSCLGLSGVVIICTLTAISLPAPAPAETGNPVNPAKEIRARLSKPASLERGFPEGTSLREVVEFLADRNDLPILVNPARFQEENAGAVDELKVKLPRMMNVRLSTILNLVLAQVHATYLIHRDYLEIVPLECTRPEAWRQRRDLAPTVQAEFNGRPLDEALRELADASGINIVLDTRAGETAKISITATLNNAPVDSAVLILADMAGLRSVAMDNVLYVTNKEKAEQLLAWQEKQAEMATGQQ